MNTNPFRRRWLLKSLLALLALLLVIAAPVGVQYWRYMVPDTPLPAERLEQRILARESRAPADFADAAGRAAERFLEEAGLPSLAVAVWQDGSIDWTLTIGYADLDSGTPATPDTLYRLGSVAKAVTGTLTMRLVDQGRVGLDQTVGELAPALPERFFGLSLRQLASHTAGIRHYRFLDFNFYTGNPWSWDDGGLSIFAGDELLFAPGADFRYTTYGYTLLSRVLAEATGTDFPALLNFEIFAPAGMRDATVERQDRIAPRQATFYTTGGGQYTVAMPQDVAYKWAGGGMLGSVEDLKRFARALLNGGLLSDEARQTLWSPVKLPGGEANPQNYALGWRRSQLTSTIGEDRPNTLIHHGGIQAGGSAYLALLPEYRAAIAVLTNSGAREARGAVQDLAFELIPLLVERGEH